MSLDWRFWLVFLLALLNGQVNMSEDSSISSDNLVPEVHRQLNWPCGEEICFIDLNTGNTGT